MRRSFAVISRRPGGDDLKLLIALGGVDPTTEVLAEKIYRFLEGELGAGKTYRDEQGLEYRFGAAVRIERVRVTETSSSWAEFAPV
jgi:6-pyruvoyltetrahydropterin/6-carboxytetrahydropterin synthase